MTEGEEMPEDSFAEILTVAWPIVPRRASESEVAEAMRFVDTIARGQHRGPVFRHLCVLLGDAVWSRRGSTYASQPEDG